MSAGDSLLVGSDTGTIQLHDAQNGFDLVEEYDAHMDPAFQSKPIERLQANFMAPPFQALPICSKRRAYSIA